MKMNQKIIFQIVAMIIVFSPVAAMACPICQEQIRLNIYDDRFTSNFLIMTLPIFLIGLIGAGLFHADKLQTKAQKFYGKK